MIIPQYWAEARLRHRSRGERGQQITLRRFGWSDVSQEEAQANAETRVKEALDRHLSGQKVTSRELKVPYNGADGLPIREEIVSRHGEAIVTRNLYGARCLNNPNVLFADVDFNDEPSCLVMSPILLVFGYVGWRVMYAFLGNIPAGLGGFLLGLILAAILISPLKRIIIFLTGGSKKRARSRIDQFIKNHPDWHIRLYSTPAGFRLLAMHRTFAPGEPAVTECFKALGVDKVYARMCLNQQCFRARVSPKPWRIGIAGHMKPRPGYWPVKPERMAERYRWIAAYEEEAKGYASCRFIGTLGGSTVDPAAQAIQILHDDFCRALSTRPIA